MVISNTTHKIHDEDSLQKGLNLIVEYLVPMLPKIDMEAINKCLIKFESGSIEQKLSDFKSCQIIEDYLGTLNIYLNPNSPGYVNNPNHGPYQIEFEFINITPSKCFYYCPQFVNNKLRIDQNEFKKAMDIFSKPESLLLFI